MKPRRRPIAIVSGRSAADWSPWDCPFCRVLTPNYLMIRRPAGVAWIILCPWCRQVIGAEYPF